MFGGFCFFTRRACVDACGGCALLLLSLCFDLFFSVFNVCLNVCVVVFDGMVFVVVVLCLCLFAFVLSRVIAFARDLCCLKCVKCIFVFIGCCYRCGSLFCMMFFLKF